VIPITGLSEGAIEERLEFLREIAELGTEVDAVQVAVGPPAIESEVDAVHAGPDVIRLVKEAETEGCDAVIIWCGGDPALEAARELVDIPVIGPGESMRAIASILGRRPCRITAGDTSPGDEEKSRQNSGDNQYYDKVEDRERRRRCLLPRMPRAVGPRPPTARCHRGAGAGWRGGLDQVGRDRRQTRSQAQ